MADDTPLAVDDVLARERRALRPDGESADSPPLSALCISGGGIRSATFGLGVIQGLAERGILEKFDYLSTVSGGGYIGSWLTAWIHRAGGLAGVIPGLRRDAPKPGPGGADPVQHLREYNSYLSPHRGVFTTDVFTLAATVLRNILLNWMVLIPLLMFVLILPRLFLTLLAFPELIYRDVIFAVPARDYGAEVLDAVSTFPLVTPGLPVLALLSLATCFFFILRYLPGVGGQDHSRFAYVVGIVVPLVTSVLAFMAYNSLYYLGSTYTDVAPPGPLVLWILAVLVVAMVANLAVGPRPFGERVRLLFGPLPGAVLFMAAGTGFASWYTTNFLLYDVNPDQDLSWAAYVTVGPPLILAGFGLGTVLFVGLSSTFLQDEDREWMSRAMAGVLGVAVVWM
ncbi:MAG TPA: patatin-like phospholipase family protein, partial [Longimicrobiales bacterium]|nr:patatin-like phospholipase family protein [Longimicrobiales bacterium]